MKKNILILGAAFAGLATAQTASAALITGNIGFTGEAIVNSTEASTATMLAQWNDTTIKGTPGGSFGSSGLFNGEAVAFAAPWNFNTSTTINNFWSVGGFTFSLINSFIDPSGTGGAYPNGSLKVDVNGTVAGNGYTTTAFAGTLTFADPNDGSGPMAFTAQWAFAPVTGVPDGASTALLLGGVLCGLGMLKWKLA